MSLASSTFSLGDVSIPDSQRAWFAVMVKGRFEEHAANLLTEKGFDVFLPKGIVTKRWSDRFKSVSSPLFEGYVFCHMELSEKGYVMCTPGVISIVGYGGKPAPVASDEMAKLRRMIDAGLQPVRAQLVAGQQVRVISGPLRGMEGNYLLSEDEVVFTVSLTLLQRAVSVKMPRSCVEVIPARPLRSVH